MMRETTMEGGDSPEAHQAGCSGLSGLGSSSNTIWKAK